MRKIKRRLMRRMKMRKNLSDFLPLTIRLFHSSFVSVCGSIFPFFHSLSVSFFLYFYLSFVSLKNVTRKFARKIGKKGRIVWEMEIFLKEKVNPGTHLALYTPMVQLRLRNAYVVEESRKINF